MNLVLLFPEDFVTPDRVCLRDRRMVHIRQVLKADIGDRVFCGQVNGLAGYGTLTETGTDGVVLSVCLDQDPPPPATVTLVLGLPRPKMLRRILLAVAGLGIKQIFLINSRRVEKSFWQSPVLNPDLLSRCMILGLEQARDTRMPMVSAHRFFVPFVTEQLPDIAAHTRGITAHPRGATVFPAGSTGPVTLAIGPEGGWIEQEVQTFERIGFVTCGAGPRILSVETAIPFLVSRLTLP